ncbi:MAG: Ycf66 family protein [Cyanobacteria bacterium P01_D01_bin.115]
MNFGTPVPLLIGIVLILGGVALFFLDKLKPGYGRDSDKVYAVLWLISGVFLLGHLNMELLASFQQLLMAGMLIAITIENIYSRSPKGGYVAQAVNEAPARGEYYRPSRKPEYRSDRERMNVRAEIDNDGPYRPRFPEDRRMIGGREEPTSRRSDYYDGGYSDPYSDARGQYTDRSAPSSDRPVERLKPSSDRIRRRRPKSSDGRYGADLPNRGWDESASGYAANSDSYSGSSDAYSGYSSHSPTEPTSYPSSNGNGDDSYVDYRPVNYPNNGESDRPAPDYGSRY